VSYINIDNQKVPLNDVWMYDVTSKSWSELKIMNATMFDGRLCHSSVLYDDRVYVYGGMKNAESTLESMAILCLDGKFEDLEDSKRYLNI
jgi:hypothetical protein